MQQPSIHTRGTARMSGEGMDPEPIAPRLEYLCRATVALAAPLAVGPTPLGERRVTPIIGGRIAGPQLAGEVLPGGADWQTVRPDGAALLDARYTLRTTDGALIDVRNRGLRTGPPAILARLARGEEGRAVVAHGLLGRALGTRGHPRFLRGAVVA
jgi:hypothetical protein